MKIYVVLNRNDILMGIFKTEKKANNFIKDIGKGRWEETWKVEIHDMNKPEAWVMVGGDSYRAAKRRLEGVK